MERFLKLVCAIALCAGSIAACGSTSTATTPTASAPAISPRLSLTTTSVHPLAGPTIIISPGFIFTSRAVAAGATITVANHSNAQHTVTADTTAGGFDVAIDPGKTVTFVGPAKPGTYGFHCNIHNFMKGTLRVT